MSSAPLEGPSSASGSAGFTTGDNIPASLNDTPGHESPLDSPAVASHTFEEGHQANLAHHLEPAATSRSRSPSRTRDLLSRVSRSISRDPFFHRDSGLSQEEEQRQNALNEVHAAQAATEAGQIDRAVRHSEHDASRSRSRTREFIKSISRSVSRDPFFKRDSGLTQEEEIRQSALAQTAHALEAHKAGLADHERRSRSRGGSKEASPLASPAASRSASHARGHLAEGGAEGATFGTSA